MRIHSYLTTEGSISTSATEKASITKSAYDIHVRNIHAAWPGRSPLLTKGQVSLRRNALTIITGPTGSGKSTLLNLLAHLLSPEDARGQGPDRVAFVSQTPFLMRGTIRDNILFGKRYEGAFYAKVIDACALGPDLGSCRYGDQTMMNGAATISGGQKARICLARAVYARCDINIFDDPLAAIDVKLSKIIIANLFGPNGLLENSITLMSSNSPHFMSVAHSLLILEDGSLTVVEAKNPLKSQLHQKDATLDNVPGPSGVSKKEPRITVEEIHPEPAADHAIVPTEQDSGHNEEPKALSRQPISRYIAYATLRNWLVAISALLSGRTVSFVATYSLKAMADTGSLADMPKLLMWFAGLSAAQVILYMVFILLAYHLCIIPTAKKLHKALVASTLAHQMLYFETTPLGDILNYFTNDLARVDLSLSGSILTLLAQYGNIIIVGVLIMVSAPQSVALIFPAIFVFWALQRTYLTKLRELRSCDVASRASILGFLQDSDAGWTLFSVFGMTEDRIQHQRYLLEENARAQFPLSSINSWLSVRLEILCVTMQVLAATALLHTSISLGTVGLVMTYVFQITNFLSVITRTTALFEADFLSFTRLQGQIDGVPDMTLCKELEATQRMEHVAPSHSTGHPAMTDDPWPSSGKVEFSQFSARYRPTLPLNLVSIDLAILPGEKVAVIGRTGAGKSSLVLALLGIIKGANGCITIDGRDISLIDPVTLRRSLALIPQTPVVFSCSVRDNLDPLGVYSDGQLLDALNESTADKALTNMREGEQNDASSSLLDLVVDSRSSLSAGQIQFLSLARVILHRSKLLILDEATASLPAESEAQFQEVIWKRCANTTVISVMHRLESTLQYDKILVLDKGSVAAFGSPKELVLAQDEYYCSMLKEGGLEEQARVKFTAQKSAQLEKEAR
ncbi:hypothetical protein LCI18_003166 [Fusarium solani-melongenae]|uniref:Uncharacterized protein n=1 Tax=Fusarium solani subsp. cucurbitae TaxID=2747967 RepID=A0ACD3YTF2_FUSSC|nr:hypothetical protein LCI18_003166 [Fusarium solani-melongenae]